MGRTTISTLLGLTSIGFLIYAICEVLYRWEFQPLDTVILSVGFLIASNAVRHFGRE